MSEAKGAYRGSVGAGGDRAESRLSLEDALRMKGIITQKQAHKGEVMVHCWEHEDSTESMSCNLDKGLYYCHGCGAKGDTVDFLHTQCGMPKAEAIDRVRGPKKEQRARMYSGDLPQAEASWVYTDRHGATLFAVLRKPAWSPHSKKPQPKYMPYHPTEKGWQAGQPVKSDRPLLWLPRLHSAPANRRVMVVEGEKCAQALRDAFPKMEVTTWQGGTKSWQKTDWGPLEGRLVGLISDADEAGRGCMRAIAAHLSDRRSNVRLWEFMGDDGADIADLLADKPKSEVADSLKRFLTPYTGNIAAPAGEDTAEPETPPDGPDRGDSGEGSLIDNRYYRILGRGAGNMLFFRDLITHGIRQVKDSTITEGFLTTIAPASFWLGGATSFSKVRKMRIAAAFNDYARKLPMVSPDALHGRGAANTVEDGYLFHLGDRLLREDGTYENIDAAHLKQIYPELPPLPYKPPSQGWHTKMTQFAESVLELNWRTPDDGLIWLGWLGAALCAGNLKWRPALWIVGPSNTGKSTLMDFSKTLFGPYCRKIDDVTEAGLAYLMADDALPVLVDEAEPERIPRRFLDLLRISASDTGGERVRGTKEGGYQSVLPRTILQLASVSVPVLTDATQQRIVFCYVGKKTEQTPGNEREVETRLGRLYHFLNENAADMRHGLVERVPRITQSVDTCMQELIEDGMKIRHAQLHGALLAGLISWQLPPDITKNLRDNLVKRHEKIMHDQKTSAGAMLSALLGTIVNTRDQSKTLAELAMFKHDFEDIAEGKRLEKHMHRTAARYGVRYIEGRMCLDHHNPELKGLMRRNNYGEPNLRLVATQMDGVRWVNSGTSLRFGERIPKSHIEISTEALADLDYKPSND